MTGHDTRPYSSPSPDSILLKIAGGLLILLATAALFAFPVVTYLIGYGHAERVADGIGTSAPGELVWVVLVVYWGGVLVTVALGRGAIHLLDAGGES